MNKSPSKISSLLIGITNPLALPEGLTQVRSRYDEALLAEATKKRDGTVETATKNFNSALKTAFHTREQRLFEAARQADRKNKRQSVKSAWAEYRLSRKQAFRRLEEAKKEARTLFKAEKKQCLMITTALRDLPTPA